MLDSRGSEEVSTWSKSDLGNVDLPHTMPLPDSAANAGTLEFETDTYGAIQMVRMFT